MSYNDTKSPTERALRLAKQHNTPYGVGAGAISEDVALLCLTIDGLKHRLETIERKMYALENKGVDE